MRRVTMVAALLVALVALVAALMMTAGIALAESFRGDDGPNRIDRLAGDDDLYGLGAPTTPSAATAGTPSPSAAATTTATTTSTCRATAGPTR